MGAERSYGPCRVNTAGQCVTFGHNHFTPDPTNNHRVTVVSEPAYEAYDVTHLVTPETRQRRIDEIHAEGYRQAISDLRQIASDIDARGGSGVVVREAANALEEKLAKEGSDG